ncbi:helix-turn-helix domain-containing protein [Flagellimonas flava]|uniref:AraC-type DNA-binding protein n=1 Tax=Flagellimonas flava TaxID=570519 RepID=A0A1M5Q5L1_9FLAO|nr:AraC family transcriptional regulator [Allomuricauda flava]SHH09101.1 AraC-type DNA-binding protein [Allomuricauda flava]
MLFDWKCVLLLLGAGNCIIIGLILLFGNTSHVSKFLGLLTTFFGFHFAEYGVFGSEKSFDILASIFAYRYPFRLLMGPLILLFAQRALNHRKKNLLNSLNFIAPALSLVFLFPFFRLDVSEKSLILRNFRPFTGDYYSMLFSILWILSLVSLFVYSLISLKKIGEYNKQNLNRSIAENEFVLLISKQVLVLCILVLGGYIICLFLRFTGIFHSSPLYYVLSIILTGHLVFCSAKVVAASVLSKTSFLLSKKGKINSPNNRAFERLAEKNIKMYLLEKECYLNSNYSIDHLAIELEINRATLSAYINNTYGTSFPNLINLLRIEHSKTLLWTTDLKILAVALDSGFSNKTNFHRVFKSQVGTTPNKFRLRKDKFK